MSEIKKGGPKEISPERPLKTVAKVPENVKAEVEHGGKETTMEDQQTESRLEARKKEIREIKEEIEKILQEITNLWEKDAGWALILKEEQKIGTGWGKEHKQLNEKLAEKTQEFNKIEARLKKKLLFKSELERYKTALEKEIDETENQLARGERKFDKVRGDATKLEKKLNGSFGPLDKFMKLARTEGQAATSVLEKNFPFIEYNAHAEEESYKIKNYLTMFQKFGYVRNLENTQE